MLVDGTHICDICKTPLEIGEVYPDFINDHTPDMPTEVYNNLPMLCPNQTCSNWRGVNASKPLVVVETVRNLIYKNTVVVVESEVITDG